MYNVRNYELILYTLEECNKAVQLCIDNGFDYAYIMHDKDLKDDLSDFKKLHYHFLVFMQNAKTLTAFNRIFDFINENRIQFVRDKKKAIRYLIHADNNDKANYDIDNIKANIELYSYFSNIISNESVEVEIILDFLNQDKVISFQALMRYVTSNGCWSTYRRNYSIIKDLVYEHNLKFSKVIK